MRPSFEPCNSSTGSRRSSGAFHWRATNAAPSSRSARPWARRSSTVRRPPRCRGGGCIGGASAAGGHGRDSWLVFAARVGKWGVARLLAKGAPSAHPAIVSGCGVRWTGAAEWRAAGRTRPTKRWPGRRATKVPAASGLANHGVAAAAVRARLGNAEAAAGEHRVHGRGEVAGERGLVHHAVGTVGQDERIDARVVVVAQHQHAGIRRALAHLANSTPSRPAPSERSTTSSSGCSLRAPRTATPRRRP